MKDAIVQAGFEDVVEKRFKIPIGPWSSDPRSKDIGWWYRHHWETGMEGWALAPAVRHLGVSCHSGLRNFAMGFTELTIWSPLQWTIEQVDSLLRETSEAMYDSEMHVYSEMCVNLGYPVLAHCNVLLTFFAIQSNRLRPQTALSAVKWILHGSYCSREKAPFFSGTHSHRAMCNANYGCV